MQRATLELVPSTKSIRGGSQICRYIIDSALASSDMPALIRALLDCCANLQLRLIVDNSLASRLYVGTFLRKRTLLRLLTYQVVRVRVASAIASQQAKLPPIESQISHKHNSPEQLKVRESY